MNVNEVVHKVGAQAEGAAGRERIGVGRRISINRQASKNSRRGRVAREQFSNREGTDIVGAGAGGERQSECRREARRKMIDQRERFDSREIRVKDKERARSSWRNSRMKNGDRMGNSRWEREVTREKADGSRKRKAFVVDTVEVGKDMVAKTGRKQTGCRKARGWRWKHADRPQAEANPATSMDSVVVKGRSSGAHVK